MGWIIYEISFDLMILFYIHHFLCLLGINHKCMWQSFLITHYSFIFKKLRFYFSVIYTLDAGLELNNPEIESWMLYWWSWPGAPKHYSFRIELPSFLFLLVFVYFKTLYLPVMYKPLKQGPKGDINIKINWTRNLAFLSTQRQS